MNCGKDWQQWQERVKSIESQIILYKTLKYFRDNANNKLFHIRA